MAILDPTRPALPGQLLQPGEAIDPIVPHLPLGPAEEMFAFNRVNQLPGPFRYSGTTPTTLNGLGPLADLPGTWIGTGFNLISRPDHQGGKPFFLELNSTRETLTFTAISAPIPNRGSVQNDIQFLGVTYIQQVSDQVTLGGLHVEPGIWLNVPATDVPKAAASVVRLATIPHGDALLAQGSSFTVPAPQFAPVSSTPIVHATGKATVDPAILGPFAATAPPPGIPAAAIANPNVVLQNAVAGQNITKTIVMTIQTVPNTGIQNIPFLVANANPTEMTAIFWIETVVDPHIGTFLQLQYVQTVTLNFGGLDWPHISVATLRKN